MGAIQETPTCRTKELAQMTHKPPRKPQSKRVESDPEEYQRFLEMAKAVEASDDSKDFDSAFKRVVAVKRVGHRSRGDA